MHSFIHSSSCVWCQLQIGTCHRHLPFTSARIKSRASVAADLQHPLQGVQEGAQKGGALRSAGGEKLAGQVLR